MSIGAGCTVRMCFIESSDSTAKRVDDFIARMLKHKDLKHCFRNKEQCLKRETITYDGKECACYVIEINGVSDTNFWVERYGLAAMMDNRPYIDFDNIKVYAEWRDGYKLFCKTMLCSVEIETFVYPEHKERIVVGVDGDVLFEEENNDTSGCEDQWDNPDYGKKKFLDIIAEHYAELKVATDLLDV